MFCYLPGLCLNPEHGAERFSETLLNFYQTARRKIPEGYGHENLRSHMFIVFHGIVLCAPAAHLTVAL
jgi:hypothetical protein